MSVAALAHLRVSVAARPLCVPLALSLSPVSESVTARPLCVRLLPLVLESVAVSPSCVRLLLLVRASVAASPLCVCLLLLVRVVVAVSPVFKSPSAYPFVCAVATSCSCVRLLLLAFVGCRCTLISRRRCSAYAYCFMHHYATLTLEVH